AVQLAGAVLEGRDRRRRRGGGYLCAARRSGDSVAVAHPDGLIGRQVLEEGRLLRLELRLPELRDAGRLDRAPQVAGHELHPVADAERRNAELEDLRVDVRSALRIDGSRTSGEHERDGTASQDLVGRQSVAHELREDARLTDAARDQLAVL